MKKILTIVCSLLLVLGLCACSKESTTTSEVDEVNKYEGATVIVLNNDSATINGEAIEEFDYTWNVDPTTVHEDVDNCPAEYYTGTKPETDAVAYIDHELYYFPELSEEEFKLVNYDGENEWAYYYQDGENDEYIFATLPCFNGTNSLPTNMMHTSEEASENKVLHITSAGTYVLQGTWKGQINVDLGEEAFDDESAKVTVILNGVDITCSVAPGIVFNAYEVDNTWEDKEEYSADVDTTEAGVNVIIADGTSNSVDGQNIYRMLKTKYKDEDSTDAVKVQKKVRKMDAAFYSFVTMNIKGEEEGGGTLEVTSSFEGLDTELHLSFLGGNVTINSQDDGINVNEDNVSVVSFLGGNLTINAGLGAEGDGVDSNGYVVIDGGNLNINNVTAPDNAVDSEDGITYKSGTVTVDGEEVSLEVGTTKEINGANQGMGGGMGQQGEMPSGGFEMMDNDFDIVEFKQKVSELSDDATLQDVMELLGMNNFGGGQMPGGNQMGGDPGQMGNGETPPEIPDGQQGEMPNEKRN